MKQRKQTMTKPRDEEPTVAAAEATLRELQEQQQH